MNMQQLQRWRGKTALVTGASGGIGDAIARALANIGVSVAVMARREERLDALAKELRDGGADILVCSGDVSKDADVHACFERIRAHWGALDILVNNAGTGKMSTLAEGKPDDWRSTLGVNVAAPALFIQEALRDMEGKDEAQIINIASIYGHRDQVPNFSFYQASKFAFRALTNTLRAELAAKDSKVRVGMISPGMVATEFRERATNGAFAYESYFEAYEPLMPTDIADAALYMLSTRANVQVQDILLSPMGQKL
jgi:NADP-dependent 3-hydroxy acid dehydrogenase YdfG